MILYIKNKFISLGGSSYVLDENENKAYMIKGKVFSITKKKKIYDENKKLIYKIRNKFFHLFFHSVFVMDAKGNKIALLRQKLSLKTKLIVEGYQDEIKIEGEFFKREFSILRNGEVIGTVTKKFLTVRDSYSLNVKDPIDAPFLVALIIGIDNILDRNRNE